VSVRYAKLVAVVKITRVSEWFYLFSTDLVRTQRDT